MADHITKAVGSGAESREKARRLGQRELAYHSDVMQVNEDYKNYNGWSHRLFIVQKFGLWDNEMPFVEDLLRDDIRNNSAWNHRYTVVRNTSWPISEEVRQRELQYTFKSIRTCADNESAWNYLAAFLGEDEGRVSWDSVPSVEALAREVIGATLDGECPNRFAVEVLAKVHAARGEVTEALLLYGRLQEIDKIRKNYWDWQASLLKPSSALAAATPALGGYAAATPPVSQRA